jgi:hypothetical protein
MEKFPGLSRNIKNRLSARAVKMQNSLPVRGLQQALTAPEPLTSSLRLPALQQIIEYSDNYSQAQLYQLLTLVLLVEKTMTGVTSLAALED